MLPFNFDSGFKLNSSFIFIDFDGLGGSTIIDGGNFGSPCKEKIFQFFDLKNAAVI